MVFNVVWLVWNAAEGVPYSCAGLFLVVALGWGFCETATVFAQPAYKGMSYTSFGSDVLSGAPSDQSLYDLSVVGANTVALNVWWFQQTPSSTTIAEDDSRYSSTMSSIQHAIDTIHSLGMNVLLKPMVDVDDGTWRAQITPTNVNDWFASYTNFIDTFANLAQSNQNKGVTMLSVGCELNSMEQYTPAVGQCHRRRPFPLHRPTNLCRQLQCHLGRQHEQRRRIHDGPLVEQARRRRDRRLLPADEYQQSHGNPASIRLERHRQQHPNLAN